jgi:hypothetical protein
MTTTASTSGSMPFPPMFRMPPRPSQDEASKTTDGTSTAASSTSTSTASTSTSSTDASSTQQAGGQAPQDFEGFEGKFPNFGGGNMGQGGMPPFGQRETFL